MGVDCGVPGAAENVVSEVQASSSVRLSTTPSLQEAIDDLERLGKSFPLVVKPPRGYGTDGVTVCNSHDEYRKAVRSALVRTNKYSEPNRYAVIQEYLEGDEYHVDTVSSDGFHKVIAIWKADRSRCGAPFPYKTTLVCRSRESRVIESYAKSILSALGLFWGPASTDIKRTPSGPKLIELNARLHGSLDSLPVSLTLGTNQAVETAKAYIDPEGFRQETEQPRMLKQACAKVYLISPLKGILKQDGICSSSSPLIVEW
jgi:biotin carboxylase